MNSFDNINIEETAEYQNWMDEQEYREFQEAELAELEAMVEESHNEEIELMFVTDCDYCGAITTCFNSIGGGTCCPTCGDPETGEVYPDADFGDDDGQPSEYEEWQDYMGGDDWDHGQYDHDYDFDMYSEW